MNRERDSSVPGAAQFWLRRWDRFWFSPTGPFDLGVCRALFCGALLAWYATRDFAAWGAVDPVFWRPLPVFRALLLSAAAAPVLAALAVAWKLALLGAALGLFTRASTLTAALLGFYLLGLPHNFGKVNHNDAVVVIVLVILACSRCGDAFSLDAVRRSRRDPLRAPTLPSGDYTWPVRAVWVLLSLAYFAAGVSKVKTGAWAWTMSDTLSIYLLNAQHDIANAPPLTTWGAALATYKPACRLLAVLTLLVELGYPLALVSVRLRWFFVPAAVGMHLGIRVLLGPTFEEFILCALFWVPWSRLAGRLGRRAA